MTDCVSMVVSSRTGLALSLRLKTIMSDLSWSRRRRRHTTTTRTTMRTTSRAPTTASTTGTMQSTRDTQVPADDVTLDVVAVVQSACEQTQCRRTSARQLQRAAGPHRSLGHGPSSTHTRQYRYTDIAKFAGHLPHRYGNSRAIWDHTVLPATRQR